MLSARELLVSLMTGLLALILVVFGVFYYYGCRYIRQGEAASFRPGPGPWPRAAVIVPVAGASAELRENLRSRLIQDYPDYQVIFAVRSEADPAAGVIKTLLPEFPLARLVLCGPASGCSQKNHNLLMGIQAAAPDVAVLVFSDANQTTPAHWLQALVQPLARGEALVSSSYHHVIPQDTHLATLGRSLAVFMIYLGKGIASWDQPWGGSTAIKRQAFDELQISRLWSQTVVDDVSLAKRLQEARVKMAAAVGGVLATPARENLASWENWFIRQIIYLKFYFYLPWLLAGVGLFALLGVTLLALAHLGLAVLGWAAWTSTGPSLVVLLSLVVFLGLIRPVHPGPGPWPRYLNAALLTLIMAAWCHYRTWFAWGLRWRHLYYTVDRQGLVTGIQEV